MAFSFNKSIRIPDEVVFRELDGESVVLNIESGIYFGLDDTGTRIWQWLAGLPTLQAVRAAMHEEFDAPPQQLDADLLAFVEQLHSKGLIVVA